MKKIAISALAVAVLSPPAALAGSYEALCGDIKCTVYVSSAGIRSVQGSIPPSRISYWSVNGESSTSVGTGVATTILFGGIGLLGFLAKNHDFSVFELFWTEIKKNLLVDLSAFLLRSF